MTDVIQRPPLDNGRKVEVTLLYLAATGNYEVQEITNSACYRPGEWLSWETVIEICKLDNWTVKSQSFELLKKIMDVMPKLSVL